MHNLVAHIGPALAATRRLTTGRHLQPSRRDLILGLCGYFCCASQELNRLLRLRGHLTGTIGCAVCDLVCLEAFPLDFSQTLMAACPLACAARCTVADHVSFYTFPLHVLKELQGRVRLLVLFTCADRCIVGEQASLGGGVANASRTASIAIAPKKSSAWTSSCSWTSR